MCKVIAVSSPGFTREFASRKPPEMHVNIVALSFLISACCFDPDFMMSLIGTRWKWQVTSPSPEYEIRVTTRLNCVYSSQAVQGLSVLTW